MSRRRQHRRAEKARRHAQLASPTQQSRPAQKEASATPPQVAVRAASRVERLAYSRTQAAQALGISRSTLHRLMPYIETIELPWGSELIPVDELERVVDERRRPPQTRDAGAPRGRPPMVRPEVVERIRVERAAGKSLRQIATGLNIDGTPTAHHGQRWWPSTVRGVLLRP